MTGGNLENAVLPVEMEQKNARVPASVPLRLVEAPIAQDPAQIQNLVIMARALVSDYLAMRSVALEGERSNCFSITQLVGQKRQ